MKWVRAADHEYLVRLRDARGNGKSLVRRSPETERIYAAFTAGKLVGVTGFEPATSASRRQRSTSLSYTPMNQTESITTIDCEPGQADQRFSGRRDRQQI